MAKQLDKTLQVDGETYDINSKLAERVEKDLKIKKNLLTTTNETTFNGSAEEIIDFVPATGGRFSGKIRVPENNDVINAEDVLNYGDLKDRVMKELTNSSVLYVWDGSTLVSGTEGESDIKSVCIITGTDSNVNDLAKYIYDNKPISAYIYVDADTGSIYFGTSNFSKIIPVKVSAESAITATQLTDAHTFSVSLESSNTATFDGTSDVALGVNGTLPISKGGTGATTAADAINSLGISPANIGAAPSNHTHLYAGSTTAGGAAAKAVADSEGTPIRTGYYRSISNSTNANTITLSTSSPSGGNSGDIWIKYTK